MAVIKNPFEQWVDPTIGGRVIYNANIYVGQPDTDPTIPENRLQVYYIDENKQRIDLAQPITTNTGGFTVISETNPKMIKIQVDESNYSITVQDRNKVAKWIIENVQEESPVIKINDVVGLNNELDIRPVSLTVAEAKAKTDLKVGQYVILTDRADGLFKVNPTGTVADGFGSIGIDSGPVLVVQDQGEPLNAKHFGAVGDGSNDDTAALQAVIDYGFENDKSVYIPAGTYKTTQSLNVRFKDTDYGVAETVIFGDGRNLTNIACDYTDDSNPISIIRAYTESGNAGYNLNITQMALRGIHSNNPAIDGLTIENTLGYGDFNDLYILDTRNAFVAQANMFLTNFTHIMMSRPKTAGLVMGISGTSCTFDRCFIAQGGTYPDGTQNDDFVGFEINGVYMTVGALACDNSVGIAYDFRFFSGEVGSLGSENVSGTQNLSKFLYTAFGNCSIGYAYSLDVSQDSEYIHHHHIGEGVCDIDILRVSDNRGETTSGGQLIRQTNGFVRHGKITSAIEFTHVDTGAATTNSAIYETGNAGTGVAFSRGNRRPYMGANRQYYETHGAQNSDRQVQAIYMDQYGSPTRGGASGGINYQFITPPSRGDWTMESDPSKHLIAGSVVTEAGEDWNRSKFASILIGNSGTTAERPAAGFSTQVCVWFNTETGSIDWYDGANWRSPSP